MRDPDTNGLAATSTILLICASLGSEASGEDFYAAPGGASVADGSREQPWDLASALENVEAVGPGDTLWLQAGTYQADGLTSKLQGAPGRPVTVRSLPHERVTIDCRPVGDEESIFAVLGDWSVFWGLEFTCSDPKRETDQPGSWPDDIQRAGIDCRGSHVRFINLVVHDMGVGIRFWDHGEGGEIYGCLLYNNGWQAPDRGHGHGIYTQNRYGKKRLIDNIVFNQFGNGIACYGSDQAFLNGYRLESNVVFNNGAPLGPQENTLGIIVGGECPVRDARLTKNMIYNSSVHLGYPWGPANEDAVLLDNYVMGSVYIKDFQRLTFRHNTLISDNQLATVAWLDEVKTDGYEWDENRYYKTAPRWHPFSVQLDGDPEGQPFPQWRDRTGFDAASSYSEERPRGTKVFVRPNRYEAGRAHIVVYNWDKAEEVEVDLGQTLSTGQPFHIVSAQDFYGAPILQGVYQDEPIKLPMKPVAAAKPIGLPQCPLPVTEPEFGVFVVVPHRGAAGD